jgi:hypothetical protein
MTGVTAGTSLDGAARSAPEGLSLPEGVMLLLFNPRNGTIAGEGLPLMYTLGGAMLTELATRGHIELDIVRRSAHAVGDAPADQLLRGAWERIPTVSRGTRSIVVDIGPRLRESTLNALMARGEIRQVPHRFLGLFTTKALEGGDTDTRERLLGPVRATLMDGVEPDSRTAALIALLSASGNLPAMDADIPWSGDVYTRGTALERGEWGAQAASDIIMAAAVSEVVGTAFATTVARLARPE